MTYIEAIQDAIRKTHGCSSRHIESISVHEVFRGETVWEGMVEVFALEGHRTARRCYAWGYQNDSGHGEYVAVLQVPPVDSPQKAVEAYILSQHGCEGGPDENRNA
jgi:hypothetical protein